MIVTEALDSLRKFFGSRGERKTTLNGREVLVLDSNTERAVFVEEPRQSFSITAHDVMTFLAYIKDIGAEYTNPSKYGNHPVMDELQIFLIQKRAHKLKQYAKA